MIISLHNKSDTEVGILRDEVIAECSASTNFHVAQMSDVEYNILEDRLREDKHLTSAERQKELSRYSETGKCATSVAYTIDQEHRLQVLRAPVPLSSPPDEDMISSKISHIDPRNKQAVAVFLRKHLAVFAKGVHDFSTTNKIAAAINLVSQPNLVNSKYANIPVNMHQDAEKILVHYVNKGILSPTDVACPFVSNLAFQTAPNGETEIIIDSRVLNINSTAEISKLASHEQILSKLANKRFYSTMQIANAHFSIPLTPETRHLTSFYDHRKNHYCFNVIPKGWINADFHLERLLKQVLGNIKECFWIGDKITVASSGDFRAHLAILERVMSQLKKANLKLWHEKLLIDQPFVEFLGIMYQKHKFSIPNARCQGFADLPYPKNAKQLAAILVSFNPYSKFIQRYAELVEPLVAMSKQKADIPFDWTEAHDEYFQELIAALITATSLNFPRADRTFVCHSDASQKAISFTIEQRDQEGNLYPIAFLSRVLNTEERKYSTFRKEATALVYGLATNNFFLQNAKHIEMSVDAKGLLSLRSCQGSNPALAKILQILSATHIEIFHLAGVENVTADNLSRMHKDLGTLDKDIRACLKPMTEIEATVLLNKLNIPDGYCFSPSDVYNILSGDALPSLMQKTRPIQPRKTTFYSHRASLPILKPERKIKMPRIRQKHPLYPTQSKDLAKLYRKQDKDKQQQNSISSIVETDSGKGNSSYTNSSNNSSRTSSPIPKSKGLSRKRQTSISAMPILKTSRRTVHPNEDPNTWDKDPALSPTARAKSRRVVKIAFSDSPSQVREFPYVHPPTIRTKGLNMRAEQWVDPYPLSDDDSDSEESSNSVDSQVIEQKFEHSISSSSSSADDTSDFEMPDASYIDKYYSDDGEPIVKEDEAALFGLVPDMFGNLISPPRTRFPLNLPTEELTPEELRASNASLGLTDEEARISDSSDVPWVQGIPIFPDQMYGSVSEPADLPSLATPILSEKVEEVTSAGKLTNLLLRSSAPTTGTPSSWEYIKELQKLLFLPQDGKIRPTRTTFDPPKSRIKVAPRPRPNVQNKRRPAPLSKKAPTPARPRKRAPGEPGNPVVHPKREIRSGKPGAPVILSQVFQPTCPPVSRDAIHQLAEAFNCRPTGSNSQQQWQQQPRRQQHRQQQRRVSSPLLWNPAAIERARQRYLSGQYTAVQDIEPPDRAQGW
jgi:hypothetical protein